MIEIQKLHHGFNIKKCEVSSQVSSDSSRSQDYSSLINGILLNRT